MQYNEYVQYLQYAHEAPSIVVYVDGKAPRSLSEIALSRRAAVFELNRVSMR